MLLAGESEVICAGYEEEMDEFFESNPGFKLLGWKNANASLLCWI